MGEDERVRVDLDSRERVLLRAALLDWGGPASPTDEIAAAIGFTDAANLASEAWTLWKEIEAENGLTVSNWRRALLAVEIVFASDAVGSGLDWASTSGISDEESITILRGLQRKLPRWRDSFQFGIDDAGRVTLADPHRPHDSNPPQAK